MSGEIFSGDDNAPFSGDDSASFSGDDNAPSLRDDEIQSHNNSNDFLPKRIQRTVVRVVKDSMNNCSYKGKVKQLDEILQDHLANGTPLVYTEDAISYACEAGHLEVLEWWWRANQEYGVELKCSEDAVAMASCCDHTDILDWLYENTEYKYTHYALDRTYSLNVLDWWLKMSQDHGVKLLYTTEAVDMASTEHNILALDWWWTLHTNHQYEFLCSTEAIDNMIEDGDDIIATLDWWLQHHLEYSAPFLYTEKALDNCELYHPKILKWWWVLHQTYGKDFLYTEKCIDDKCMLSDELTLEYYQVWQDLYENHGIPIKFTTHVIDRCIRQGNFKCLDWWCYMYTTHDLPVKFSEKSVRFAIKTSIEMVEWVYRQHQNHGFLFHVDESVILAASLYGGTEILELLHSYGLVKGIHEGLVDNIDDTSVLQWWWDHCELYQYPFIYTQKAVDKCINEAVRNWFYDAHKKYGIPFLYSHRTIDTLSAHGQIASLEWWEKRNREDGMELMYSSVALDSASKYGEIEVLNWWEKMHAKGFELRYTKIAMDYPSAYGNFKSLNWWKQQHQNGIELKFTHEKIATYRQEVQKWWADLLIN